MENTVELLIATTNQGKLFEFQKFFEFLPLRMRGLREFPDAAQIDETGSTFVANADLKAAGYARATNTLTLADDSGLEVAALDNAPGVFSARWGGAHLTDGERNEKLLSELSKIEPANRRARFVCAISIADGSGTIICRANGICSGTIADKIKGANGFGYDPIFIPDDFDRSFGELSDQVKKQIGHRARAVEEITRFLQTFLPTKLD